MPEHAVSLSCQKMWVWNGFLVRFFRSCETERGLSQEELGFESDYHRTYISQLERGQKNPSLKAIFRLARVLGIRPSEMIQKIESRVEE